MTNSHQFCTFLLDDYLFGVDVRQVQEVFRAQDQTPVPLAPSVISGLLNLRGQIVTALDLRLRLALAARPHDDEPLNVVVRTTDGLVSLLVDEIGEVITVTTPLEPVPNVLDGIASALIRGVYTLPQQLVLVLDIEETIDLSVLTPIAG